MSHLTSWPDWRRLAISCEWSKVAKDWVLPISLAVVVSGQIYFSAARFLLGVEHPAWPFWILLIFTSGFCVYRGWSCLKATHLDGLMLIFVAILTASTLFLGAGGLFKAVALIASFILLPYLAGRLLSQTGARRFIFSSLIITLFSLPLIGFGLLNMTESELQTDRLGTLFSTADTSSMAGVSAIPHASIALGLLLILMTAFVSNIKPACRSGQHILLIVFMCAALWMLIFIGLRAAILAALMVSLILVFFGKGTAIGRIVLLCILVSTATASWVALPVERKAHFSQLSAVLEKEPYYQSHCVVYGDSIKTRMRMSDAAFELALDSPLIGVGAGNFGIKSNCNFGEAFMSPHGLLQQTLSEVGLIGLIAYLALIYYTALGFMKAILTESRRPDWLIALAGVWCFFLFQDLISGNYFFGHHFFAATGVVGGLMAARQMEWPT